ncbi:GHKL domain-containing protein [Lacihabitans sp. LS3-19]|uniref:ATP-binding protein n=1 Tax=Lacihabitans sp. LS3-19 TaxID=2487335 RepID=UPI0020CC7729|nr:ATP-binding protein [Lacihabitans sp. LS3-19]MCP9767314.1 GHKL domain-containing protein [Lacihabitans sp. LS3-19]
MNGILITIVSILYLGVLFYLAFVAEKFKGLNKSLINNPFVFAFSLAVYCTAWTFYGSVGRVDQTGIEFLSVYIGPTLVMLLGWSVLRKIIRISHVHRITSIADFISARYGKYRSLGVWVTIISLLAGIPYIGLQIKAISSSFSTLTGVLPGHYFFQDSAFYIALILIAFTLLFGTRKVQSNETHEGMVLAIAAESIFKLIAFLIVGIYVTYWINDGFGDIFEKHYIGKEIQKAFEFDIHPGYGNWFMHIMVSALSFMFLPRQFQVAVVENQNEKNLKQAMWLLPLYLFLINIFVIPIALTGNSFFASNPLISGDNYVIELPLKFSSNSIALIAYIGGFSAATGMIIVETIAISTMITNSIILPSLLESRKFKEKYTFKILNIAIWSRRASIILTVLLGFFYYKTVAPYFSLVSIGLIAFVAIGQFSPALLGGIFWKDGNKTGALAGLLSGFIIWLFALIIPPIFSDNQGHFYYPALAKFYELFSSFKIENFDEISNTTFWSLMVNAFMFFGVSMATKQSPAEEKQALLFVDVFKYSNQQGQTAVWRGNARNEQLKELLASFIGKSKAEKEIEDFSKHFDIVLDNVSADPKLVAYIENIISGIIGTSTARLLVSSISKEEVVSIDEVLAVLKRSQKILEDNEELKTKTFQLEKISKELQDANLGLQQADDLKNEFLTTVTHEIRTPLTSIKALSEIIYDNEDLEYEQKKSFLNIIIDETDRLSRLVNQVLDLEKYESGKHKISKKTVEVNEILNTVLARMEGIAKEKNVLLKIFNKSDVYSFKADEDRLIQMFINLISNAIKFVKPNEGWVHLSVDNSKKYLIFSVEDNGVGIPVETQSRIFEKFFQAENQDQSSEKGSGLGLSITKKIVEIHKGNIHLESVPGKGTKIMVSLPL